jgi:hypothetical protein
VAPDTIREPISQILTEIQSGDGLSLYAVGRLFPGHRGGASVSPATVFRWVKKGTRIPNGRIVRLEAVRIGNRWLTSRNALARFVATLTAASDVAPTPPSRSSSQSARASQAAERELIRRGA